MSSVKILVNYIKPSTLYKSEILIPIHLGRSIAKSKSKDGEITNSDLDWLYKNCIGDDDFDGNISYLNRRVGFLTGTYWAWKNYDKLNDPEYFGSFGYRRHFHLSILEEIQNYDIVLPKKRDLCFQTIQDQFITYHGEALYNRLVSVFKNIYPNEKDNLLEYMNQTQGYYDEIYIMKKTLFFEFCEWIFPLLFEYAKLPPLKLPIEDLRDIGFIMERISGYYFQKLTQKYSYKEIPIVVTEKLVVNKDFVRKSLLKKLRERL